MTYIAIEQAVRNAWPALEEEMLPYGVLRFSRGYTKRANSLCLFNSRPSRCAEIVNRCENFFGTRSQPSIVRIPSFSNQSKLDLHLKGCGYDVTGPSLVMSRPLSARNASMTNPLRLDEDAWLDAYYEISGDAISQRDNHQLLLQKIPGERLLACLESVDGEPASCAIAILFNNVLGIFGVATNPAYRRKNYATQILHALMAWGRNRRASHVYLQVAQENHAARVLYEKAGFKTLYHYWYREKVLG